MNLGIPTALEQQAVHLASPGRYYRSLAFFSLREEFSDRGGAVASLLLFPVAVVVLGAVWTRYGGGTLLTQGEVFCYLAMTELLFLTMLRSALMGRAARDFSLGLARPRSWLGTTVTVLLVRCVGQRVLYLLTFTLLMPALGYAEWGAAAKMAARMLALLPLVSLTEALFSTVFAIAQSLWHRVESMKFLAGKLFLIFGGVVFPLAEVRPPWRDFLLAQPFADAIFQPAWFAVKGEFHGMGTWEWLARISLFHAALLGIVLAGYAAARRHHQSIGG